MRVVTDSQDGVPRRKRIIASPSLIRIASRLGISINDLVARTNPGSVRKTQFPVLEEQTKDGKVIYRPPSQIVDGPRSR